MGIQTSLPPAPHLVPPLSVNKGLGASRKPNAVGGVLHMHTLLRVLELLSEKCHIFRVNWTKVFKS